MAAKKKTPPEIIGALCEAGYELVGFTRHNGQLTVRLVPSNPVQALETCQAMGLKAECRVFAAVPQDVLIVTITPQPSSPKPKA